MAAEHPRPGGGAPRIAYDFRGNGNSDEPTGPVTMTTFVDDTLALLDALGIDRAHVYGQSFGGMVGQELALTRPERARTLILGCTHAGPRHVLRGKPSKVPEGRALALDVRAGVPERASRARGRRPPDRGGPAEASRGRATTMGGDAGVRQLRPPPRPPRVPTLVVHGAEDQAISVENARLSADRIPGAELVLQGEPGTCTTPSRPKRPTPRSWTSFGDTRMAEAPPDEVVRLAEERAAARAARDFEAADAIRERIASAGWSVVDDADGFRLEPDVPAPEPVERIRAVDVVSVLDDEPDVDATVHWVCEGWPEDIERALKAFRTYEGGRSVQYVIADVTDRDPTTWGDDVEVVWLEEGTGWAPARNAGLKRTRGSHRADRRRLGRADRATCSAPLEAALEDPHRRRVRPVRDRDPRSPAVRRGRRRRRRRDRGLSDGARRETLLGCGVLRREVPLVPHRRHRVLVPDEGSRSPSHGGRRSRHEARTPDVVRDEAAGPCSMVEEELLSVPRPVPRPVGSVGRPASRRRARITNTAITTTTRPGPSRSPASAGQAAATPRVPPVSVPPGPALGSVVGWGTGLDRRGIRDPLRPLHVGLQLVPVDHLGGDQQRRQPVQQVTVLRQDLGRAAAGLVQEPADLLVDQLRRVGAHLGHRAGHPAVGIVAA